MAKLDRLANPPSSISAVACLAGAARYLGGDKSLHFAMGASGMAFILCVNQSVDPSGPNVWIHGTEWLRFVGEQLGCSVTEVYARHGAADFAEAQRAAWDLTRESLDQGMPCFGWQVGGLPEYYIICGYDDDGYLAKYDYPGPFRIEERKRWSELGTTDTQILSLCSVRRAEPPPGDPVVLARAIQFVLGFADCKVLGRQMESVVGCDGEPKGSSVGLRAYDTWERAVLSGEVGLSTNAYNIQVWHECRSNAVEFLRLLRGKVAGDVNPLIEGALGAYETVQGAFGKMSTLCPFVPNEWREERLEPGEVASQLARCLAEAKSAEEAGLALLRQIASALG